MGLTILRRYIRHTSRGIRAQSPGGRGLRLRNRADADLRRLGCGSPRLDDSQAPGSLEHAVARRAGSPRAAFAATARLRTRSRARSRPPTARPSGRSGTPARKSRARCSTPPTCPRCASCTPSGSCSRRPRQRAADRLRTPRRRRRGLERGARIHLRHRRPGPRRDAAIPTQSAVYPRTGPRVT
jgi:hypothetical protein